MGTKLRQGVTEMCKKREKRYERHLSKTSEKKKKHELLDLFNTLDLRKGFAKCKIAERGLYNFLICCCYFMTIIGKKRKINKKQRL